MIELSQSKIEEVVKYLNAGKIVALPTETVYGLAIKYDNVVAIDNLIEIKKREGKNFTMMIADKNKISDYAILSSKAKRITNKLFPGELTIVLPKNNSFKNYLFDESKTIGIRIPNNDFMLELLKKSGPLLVTSANYKGDKPCLNSDEVKMSLDFVDVVVAGKSGNGMPSSVIKVIDNEVTMLREGNIKINDINFI